MFTAMVSRRLSRGASKRERVSARKMCYFCLLAVLTHPLGLATQLALAYAIHKSFIFVRVPLAAAITPKIVKVLRSWGWQIGKKKATR